MLILWANLTERHLVNMLEDLTAKRPVRPCKMRALLHSLSPSDQTILKNAIGSPDWTTNSLLVALRAKNIDIGYSSVRRHELRHCSCDEFEYV
jgi:hypothetical protein